ncbi:Maf family protein [Gammaproteobacteria bacterium AS21]
MKSLILASSSIYRKKLLDTLGFDYQCASPDIDETVHKDETSAQLVARLALAKAQKVAHRHSNSLIIGSDQAATVDGIILNKPLTTAKAQQQLQLCSGKKVTFLTGLCLFDSSDNSHQLATIAYHVYFRELSSAEIAHYIAIEQPLNCAGSFKVEGLGISLFEKLEGDDFNSLIGLPVIELLNMLRAKGINPLS